VVGITAGTSTPDNVINEVEGHVEHIDFKGFSQFGKKVSGTTALIEPSPTAVNPQAKGRNTRRTYRNRSIRIEFHPSP